MNRNILLLLLCLTLLASLLATPKVFANPPADSSSPGYQAITTALNTPRPVKTPTPSVPRARERNPGLVIGATLILTIILLGVILYRQK